MQALDTSVSTCRYCQYYKPVGRRGGACEILNGSVQGTWKSCHLAIPLFTPSCKSYEVYSQRSLVAQN
jgi:hypothetical protein